MHRYILKRLILLIPVIIGVSFVVFVIMDIAPGDPVYMIAAEEATAEELEQIREDLGLNRNLFARYFSYLGGLLQGDLGVSYISKRDVFQTYMTRLPATIRLSFFSMIVALVVSIPLGIMSAVNQNTWKDSASMVMALLGLSMPNFWLGLLLILIFALKLGVLPSGGDNTFFSILLPAITIGTGYTAHMTRTARSAMLDVIRQDFLRTARAKGVSEKKVINKHAFKNALIPIITVFGIQFSKILGGAVLTETIFAWPGIGRLIVDSINQRDIPMVTGCIIMTTIFASIVIMLVDIVYAFVDPRIKAQYEKGGTV